MKIRKFKDCIMFAFVLHDQKCLKKERELLLGLMVSEGSAHNDREAQKRSLDQRGQKTARGVTKRNEVNVQPQGHHFL